MEEAYASARRALSWHPISEDTETEVGGIAMKSCGIQTLAPPRPELMSTMEQWRVTKDALRKWNKVATGRLGKDGIRIAHRDTHRPDEVLAEENHLDVHGDSFLWKTPRFSWPLAPGTTASDLVDLPPASRVASLTTSAQSAYDVIKRRVWTDDPAPSLLPYYHTLHLEGYRPCIFDEDPWWIQLERLENLFIKTYCHVHIQNDWFRALSLLPRLKLIHLTHKWYNTEVNNMIIRLPTSLPAGGRIEKLSLIESGSEHDRVEFPTLYDDLHIYGLCLYASALQQTSLDSMIQYLHRLPYLSRFALKEAMFGHIVWKRTLYFSTTLVDCLVTRPFLTRLELNGLIFPHGGRLPASLGGLMHLRRLALGGCYLTSGDRSVFARLTSLECLWIERCHLTEITPGYFQSSALRQARVWCQMAGLLTRAPAQLFTRSVPVQVVRIPSNGNHRPIRDGQPFCYLPSDGIQAPAYGPTDPTKSVFQECDIETITGGEAAYPEMPPIYIHGGPLQGPDIPIDGIKSIQSPTHYVPTLLHIVFQRLYRWYAHLEGTCANNILCTVAPMLPAEIIEAFAAWHKKNVVWDPRECWTCGKPIYHRDCSITIDFAGRMRGDYDTERYLQAYAHFDSRYCANQRFPCSM